MWKNEEERDKMREQWLKDCLNRCKDYEHWFQSLFHQKEEEESEERNDVCIYKTLRYPPKSTPPTTD